MQDNEWDIGAARKSGRRRHHFAKAFPGIEVLSVDGTDWDACHQAMSHAIDTARKEQRPFMVHASVPLLGHHTSGVRREFYRDDLEEAAQRDPLPRLHTALLDSGVAQEEIDVLHAEIDGAVQEAFDAARAAEEPSVDDLLPHRFAPTSVTEERGERHAPDGELTLMVDCALHAMQEIMEDHPEALLYGQDVGARLGGVFREAATLGQKFGDHRVQHPIRSLHHWVHRGHERHRGPDRGSPVADYLWPGLNQLFTELSRSYLLSNGQWPIHSLIRVPIGAYGSGGPYHSSSIESVLANIRGEGGLPPTAPTSRASSRRRTRTPTPWSCWSTRGCIGPKSRQVRQSRRARPRLPGPVGQSPNGTRLDLALAGDESTATVVTYGRGVLGHGSCPSVPRPRRSRPAHHPTCGLPRH